jgi:hypothetical protein
MTITTGSLTTEPRVYTDNARRAHCKVQACISRQGPRVQLTVLSGRIATARSRTARRGGASSVAGNMRTRLLRSDDRFGPAGLIYSTIGLATMRSLRSGTR